MSESVVVLITLRRLCDEAQTLTNSLRSLLDIMQAHRVLDTERPTEPPPESDKGSNDNPL